MVCVSPCPEFVKFRVDINVAPNTLKRMLFAIGNYNGADQQFEVKLQSQNNIRLVNKPDEIRDSWPGAILCVAVAKFLEQVIRHINSNLHPMADVVASVAAFS